ncbi:MAG: HAMP domain-containing histidine kinase [Bacteroidetes bacterium]|nr:HAMP domain-containing histidine kinase [Bacteroidota bacterium]
MTIRSKTLRWLILLSTLIVAIIVAVQIYWLQRIYRVERRQFNNNVNKSIKNLYRNIKLTKDSTFIFSKSVELPVLTSFVARIDRIPDIDSISVLFSKELTDYNLLADCNISIYDAGQKKYTESRFIDMPNSYNQYSTEFTVPVFDKKYSYICFHFPHRRLYIITQMIFWIISTVSLLLVLIGFGISVFYLYKQRFLNETQKDFVNNFTHEFKTPLSVIKIAAGVLQQPTISANPEKLRNYANIIQVQTAHLQNQLSRMLSVAYTEHSSLVLKKETFDANALMDQAISNIKPLLEEKSGSLSFNSREDDSLVTADKSYILVAYTNLLENAVKYSLKPGIIISTYIDGNDFCTSVRDNGIGIEKKQHRKIFKKFYRVTDGEIHHAKGFGLGLNFVKQIADAHKGSISLVSEPGEGSTFTIKIPRS